MNPIELLAQLLSNNIGNRLTPELASGIIAVYTKEYPRAVASGQSENGSGVAAGGEPAAASA